MYGFIWSISNHVKLRIMEGNSVHHSDFRLPILNRIQGKAIGILEIIGGINVVGSILFCLFQKGISWMDFWVFFFSMGFFLLSIITFLVIVLPKKNEYDRALAKLEEERKRFLMDKRQANLELQSEKIEFAHQVLEAKKDPVMKIKAEKEKEKIDEDGTISLEWNLESMYTNGDVQDEIIRALRQLQQEATCQRETIPSFWKKYAKSPWQKNAILKDLGLSMGNSKANNARAASVLRRIKRKYPEYFSHSPIVRV